MKIDIEKLAKELISGNREALARAITIVESTLPDRQSESEELLDLCMPRSGNSVRIGITGVPGVGKSTFIESFGKFLIREKKKKVAVLTVDPSSLKSKGSILGDKTRMAELSAMGEAFIRPSPTSGSLGGIGLATREIIILCEAAGHDIVIVETVGVGQSETEVKEIVDFFLLLMLPGAGDELQGIKRGIIELADALFINKADGDNLKMAQQAKAAYSSALHLFQQTESGWKPKVELCSATSNENIDLAWKVIDEYREKTEANSYWEKHRQSQIKQWFYEASEKRMLNTFHQMDDFEKMYQLFLSKTIQEKINPRKASRMFIDQLRSDLFR